MTATLSFFQAFIVREAVTVAEKAEPGQLTKPQRKFLAGAEQIVTNLPPETHLRKETLELFARATRIPERQTE